MFGHIREFHPLPRRKEGRMQAAGEGTSNTTGRGREARHTGPAADEPGRLRGGRVDGRRRGWGPRRSVNRPWTCPATGPGDAARPARFTKSAACAHFQNAAYDVFHKIQVFTQERSGLPRSTDPLPRIPPAQGTPSTSKNQVGGLPFPAQVPLQLQSVCVTALCSSLGNHSY